MTALPIAFIDWRCTCCWVNQARRYGGGALRVCVSCYQGRDGRKMARSLVLRLRDAIRFQRHATRERQGGRLPRRPTRTRPGTAAHEAVLARRAALGVALYHPGDGPGEEA